MGWEDSWSGRNLKARISVLRSLLMGGRIGRPSSGVMLLCLGRGLSRIIGIEEFTEAGELNGQVEVEDYCS